MMDFSPSWFASSLLSGRPTVGALMSLCEENFVLLLRLAPGLSQARGVLASTRPDGVDLRLEILEQSRYTTLLCLTHRFFDTDQGSGGERLDPDARLRVYHDARQVELLDLKQSILPLRCGYQRPALADKWQANLFLSKWLTFCLARGHRFGQAASQPKPASPHTRCLARS